MHTAPVQPVFHLFRFYALKVTDWCLYFPSKNSRLLQIMTNVLIQTPAPTSRGNVGVTIFHISTISTPPTTEILATVNFKKAKIFLIKLSARKLSFHHNYCPSKEYLSVINAERLSNKHNSGSYFFRSLNR